MTYKNEVIDSVIKDLYKAAKILGDIDHNLGYIDAGNAAGVIRSLEQLVMYTATDLYLLKDKEPEE